MSPSPVQRKPPDGPRAGPNFRVYLQEWTAPNSLTFDCTEDLKPATVMQVYLNPWGLK
jgi:hypothetical protein